jgi:hypothetical protein
VFATGNHLETLYGQVVFSAGSQEYCWEDVVLAAELWGDWTRVRSRLRQGLACLRASEEREAGPDEQELESAATEFRYIRDLVSAEEMEAWLTRWNVTAEAWMDYVRWSLLREMWSGQLADLVSEYAFEEGDVDRFLHVEAACSGDLDRLARELAGRVAVSEREMSVEPDDAAIAEVFRQFPAHLTEHGLPGIAPEACRAKMERLARVEVSFRRFREEGATPRRIAALIRSRRIDWTRLDLDSISFPEEQMAREAALCVREDGRSLGEVATDARRELRRSTTYLEEMDATVRDGLLGAQKGELLGPFEIGEDFVLYQVLDKTLPSLEDAALSVRAREAVLRLQLDREMNDRVKWAHPA